MRSFSTERFGLRGHMGSIFSKRVRNSGPTDQGKVRKMMEVGRQTSVSGIYECEIDRKRYGSILDRAKRQT